jgi:hypothetical protein
MSSFLMAPEIYRNLTVSGMLFPSPVVDRRDTCAALTFLDWQRGKIRQRPLAAESRCDSLVVPRVETRA